MSAGPSWADDTTDSRALRAAMVDALAANGYLPDPAWRRAFATVPRHTLVPTFYRGGDYSRVDGATEADHDAWLAAVYSDETLITQVTPTTVTSSGTMPSLLAEMLHELRVHDRARVLQVGTGTGYTAALLCARLSSRQVTTVDVDPVLADTARRRLAALGYTPTWVVGDGAAGYPPGAPFDHVIATCAVPSIPPMWLAQIRPGGRIVAPLATGLAALDVHDAGHADGRFLATAGYFMPLREAAGARSDQGDTRCGDRQAARQVRYGPSETVYQSDLRFLLALAMPEVRFGQHSPRLDDVTATNRRGSWARIESSDGEGDRVVEGGVRRLWTDVEALADRWRALGRPPRERYGVTIDSDGQRVWLDDPAATDVWTLPVGRWVG